MERADILGVLDNEERRRGAEYDANQLRELGWSREKVINRLRKIGWSEEAIKVLRIKP